MCEILEDHLVMLKRALKLRESKIQFDLETGASFIELFNHPQYLALDASAKTELGLTWASVCLRHVSFSSGPPSFSIGT